MTASSAQSPSDQLFRQLLHKVEAAGSYDRKDVEAVILRAKNSHPDDFRFSYLQAMVLASRESSHHDAFHKLATASGIAIRTMNSAQMLNMLVIDSRERSDIFYGLSHGHQAWRNILGALRSNDEELLQTGFN